tara:strand:- start:172 stop:408 length:237 start_codon:yes stop_codon:yes gene_type:complete
MAVLDPGKVVRATIMTHMIGSVAGGVAGFVAMKKYSSSSPWYIQIIGVAGGVVAGAYAQRMLTQKTGWLKSSREAHIK